MSKIKFDKVFEWTDDLGNFRFTMDVSIKAVIERYSYNSFDIFGKTNAKEFLHNQYGPAIFNLNDGTKQFWFNGKPMTPEESEKFSHDITFNDKFLDDLLKI